MLDARGKSPSWGGKPCLTRVACADEGSAGGGGEVVTCLEPLVDNSRPHRRRPATVGQRYP